MKLNIIIFIVIILPLNLAVQAQNEPKTDKPKEIQQKLTAKDYENLVTKLKGGDTNIDFRKIRLAYAETKDFSGYGGSESRKAMNVALDKKDYKAALKVIEERLKINYVDIDAHFTAFQAYKELDKKKEADFHRTIARGLIDSILENADGKTAKTAFFV